jgi:hypothetical protein
MNWYKLIMELYQEYYIQISGHKNYTFRPTGNDKKLIARYAHWMWNVYGKESVGLNILIQYFDFQFNYYCRLDTRFGRGVIMLNWVIGDKARKRWQERDKDWDFAVKFTLNRDTNQKFNRYFLTAVSQVQTEKRRKYLLELGVDERQKQRYYNSQRGFAICLSSTTLYNPKSPFCKGCLFADDCRKILQASYPKIFELRQLYE